MKLAMSTDRRWPRALLLVLAAFFLSGIALAGDPPLQPGQSRPGHGARQKSKAKPAAGIQAPEIAEMLWAVAHGSEMGPGDGWFHGGQSRYDWKWLASRFDPHHKGKITRADFRGPAAWFDRLDRNRDGVLQPADFDWSDKPSSASAAGRMLFGLLDTKGDGRITRQQWAEFFAKADRGKGYVTPDDLQEAIEAAMPKPAPGHKKDDGPSLFILVKGLVTGELGSFHEGPKVGDRAPDFALKTEDGKKSYRLSQYRGQKPAVLIFGSFT